MTTGFIYDSTYLNHDTGPGHPESPQRLLATMKHLREQEWFGKLPRFAPKCCDLALIEAIHSPGYIRRVEEACHAGKPWLDSLDVAISKDSYDVALLAAGAPIRLADEIMAGNINNGFALVRPPGHHAEKDQALGFCLFNNVAILARYLQSRHKIGNILILDWDVHHGNGTQNAFYTDPSVLYISTHQSPYYPGTGAAGETGAGAGVGTTLNFPMPAGSSDRDYETVFNEKILPKIDDYHPEFIIISAGFDAHRDDPLAQMKLSTEFYGWMTERMLDKAAVYSHERIISVLEGGYDLNALPLSIAEHLRVLSGQ
ncbi:MAG: histone deacetylase [Gammaproteobacteria bacterium]